MKKNKLKIAIISLTSCEGCEIAILDLGERLLEVLKNVELVNFKYMMDAPSTGDNIGCRLPKHNTQECDLAFIEGSPVNKKDIELLLDVRKKAKKIIALGHCAHLGGVQKMKNYSDKEKIAKYVYEQYKKIENNDGGSIGKYVKVDGVIPGCPITKEEFFKFIIDALQGKEFETEENPVCYECLNNRYECLLQKEKICLGPMTLGGCDAICLKNKQACWGCRGFLPEVTENSNLPAIALPAQAGGWRRQEAGAGRQMESKSTNTKLENLRNKLKEIASEKEIEEVEEIFGLRQME